MGTHYTWKDRNLSKGVPAQDVGQRIEQLSKEDEAGVCHPAKLVNSARPEDDPLHDLFCWDDAVAAERYRVQVEARSVIRSVRVVTNDRPEKAPAFIAVTRVTDSGVASGYAATAKVMAQPLDRQRVLREARAQLAGLRERYRSLEELGGVWSALDDVKVDAA